MCEETYTRSWGMDFLQWLHQSHSNKCLLLPTTTCQHHLVVLLHSRWKGYAVTLLMLLCNVDVHRPPDDQLMLTAMNDSTVAKGVTAVACVTES